MTVKKIIGSRRGFTLVELIVVVAILGIITAIAIPTYYGLTENSNRKIFETNHNIIVSGINMYISAHNGAYPKKAGDLKNGRYIVFEKSGDFVYDSDESSSCSFFENEPAGATYVLTFSDDGLELVSTYKDNELDFKRSK